MCELGMGMCDFLCLLPENVKMLGFLTLLILYSILNVRLIYHEIHMQNSSFILTS